MNTVISTREILMATILAISITTADAHRRPLRHIVVNPTTVVVRHATAAKTVNRFDRNDRLAMALAYIDRHGEITVKAYARLANLSKSAAEAELDVFARSRKAPIAVAMNGKKRVYVRI